MVWRPLWMIARLRRYVPCKESFTDTYHATGSLPRVPANDARVTPCSYAEASRAGTRPQGLIKHEAGRVCPSLPCLSAAGQELAPELGKCAQG